MDLHEEDKNHLRNAHISAMDVVSRYSDWVKIDCEKDLEMRSISEINKEIMGEIVSL